MKLSLVSMPWAQLDVPSLGLGILHRAALDVPGTQVEVCYANLDWFDHVQSRIPGFTLEAHEHLSTGTFFSGVADWVFSSTVWGTGWNDARFRDYAADWDVDLELCLRLHDLAPEFVTQVALRILATEPDVVGISSVFQQNLATLGLARELKRLRPGVVVVLGGANCEGPMGPAILRNFAEVDLVVRGEGERVLPSLLAALDSEDPAFDMIPGLVHRVGDRVVANEETKTLVPPDTIPVPRYDEFFDQFEASGAGGLTSPKLVVEGSRGCWWGAKHHCLFCGLNGQTMTYRSKSPERFVAEVTELCERHRCLNVYVADNILDQTWLGSAMVDLANDDVDHHFMFEVKANLDLKQLEVLRDAGAVTLQPGIESLSSHVLDLMDKGLRASQAVAFLRDADELGITVMWNHLFGFPGETSEDYERVIAATDRLVHLQPPEFVGRVLVERFAPFFERPELGLPVTMPHARYALSYDLPAEELWDLAYVFRSPPGGITANDELVGRLLGAVDRWRRGHQTSSFVAHELDDGAIELVEGRIGFVPGVHRLEGDAAQLWTALDRPRRRNRLADNVGLPEEWVQETVREWDAQGWTWCDDSGFVVRLAPSGHDPLWSRRWPSDG